MAALSTAPEHREFPFTLKEYRRLSAFVHGRTGITLPDHKINMVYSRLTRRLRELGFSAFAEYCDYYSSPEGEDEIEYLINALTTNLTRFFREKHHFELLRSHALAPLIARARAGGRVRIWSAGSSNGQEAFSIAMVLAELAPDETQACRALIEKNYGRRLREGGRDKVIAALARRGFSYGAIRAALEQCGETADVDGSWE